MNVFVVSIVTQQERKSNMRIRNGFIGSGFGEPGSLPPPTLLPRIPRNTPSSLWAEEGKEGNSNFV